MSGRGRVREGLEGPANDRMWPSCRLKSLLYDGSHRRVDSLLTHHGSSPTSTLAVNNDTVRLQGGAEMGECADVQELHVTVLIRRCSRLTQMSAGLFRWVMGGWVHKREERILRRVTTCQTRRQRSTVGLVSERQPGQRAVRVTLAFSPWQQSCNRIPVKGRRYRWMMRWRLQNERNARSG